MLKALTVNRFKSIREQTLEFGRVNLFIGGNGTGKSNLLEAVGLSSACLARGLGDSDIGSKGLRITPPELMKSSFKNEDLPKTLELHSVFSDNIQYNAILQSRVGDPLLRFFSESALIDHHRVFGRSNRGARATGVSHPDRLAQDRGIWDQIKATYEINPLVSEEFDQFSRYVIYTPQTDFLRGRRSGRLDLPPVGLHGEGLPEAASSLLRLWNRLRTVAPSSEHFMDRTILNDCLELTRLPGWTSQFGTHRPPLSLTSRDIADRSGEAVFFIDRYMNATRNRLSAYDSSEGTLFLLFSAIILAHPNAPRIFALDNVDNALNPRLTRRLIEQIIKVTLMSQQDNATLGARQVFLTSHNPTALDGFDLFDNDTRVFVVKRDQRGYTVADRLVPPEGANKQQWELAMGGRNLSQLWLDGDIPNALGNI